MKAVNSTYTPMMYNYADMLMLTLPKPRYKAYESSDFDTIRNNVLTYTDEVVTALGYY